MPPSAATMGSAAARGSRSSPKTISRLISSDTSRKNNVIAASLTSSWRLRSSRCLPARSSLRVDDQKSSYRPWAGLLATASARTVATRISAALLVSTCIRFVSGRITFRGTNRSVALQLTAATWGRSSLGGSSGPDRSGGSGGVRWSSTGESGYFSSRLRILPVAVIGRLSVTSTMRGYL